MWWALGTHLYHLQDRVQVWESEDTLLRGAFERQLPGGAYLHQRHQRCYSSGLQKSWPMHISCNIQIHMRDACDLLNVFTEVRQRRSLTALWIWKECAAMSYSGTSSSIGASVAIQELTRQGSCTDSDVGKQPCEQLSQHNQERSWVTKLTQSPKLCRQGLVVMQPLPGDKPALTPVSLFKKLSSSIIHMKFADAYIFKFGD